MNARTAERLSTRGFEHEVAVLRHLGRNDYPAKIALRAAVGLGLVEVVRHRGRRRYYRTRELAAAQLAEVVSAAQAALKLAGGPGWATISWDGYVFQAVGPCGAGSCATSPDGVAWTARKP